MPDTLASSAQLGAELEGKREGIRDARRARADAERALEYGYVFANQLDQSLVDTSFAVIAARRLGTA